MALSDDVSAESMEWLLLNGSEKLRTLLTEIVKARTNNRRLRTWYDSRFDERVGVPRTLGVPMTTRFFECHFTCRLCNEKLYSGEVFDRSIPLEARRLISKHEVQHVAEVLEEERKVGRIPTRTKN